jgi:hypothetical protein
LRKAAGGAGKDLQRLPLSVDTQSSQTIYRVYLKCYGMLPKKLAKEPHCKGLEAHLAADLSTVRTISLLFAYFLE